MWKWIAGLLAALFAIGAIGGCSALNPQGQITDMQKAIIAQAVAALDSNGITQAQMSGQVLNPGVRVEVGIVYYGTARFDGVSGQVMSATQGQTGALNQDVLTVLRGSQLSDQQWREALVTYLEQQRAAAAAPKGGDLNPQPPP